MQKMAEGFFAKILIVARVQDEGVPGIVRNLRGHRHEASLRLRAKDEIVAQPLEDPMLLTFSQIRLSIAEFHPRGMGKRMFADSVYPPLERVVAPDAIRNERADCG